ncbi:MAG: TetR/AcrR family transcriptional regulator [Clostridiales bacterium]|nr:TetR/AcrR family transcriptional regulator [Clostridiales bacterium]
MPKSKERCEEIRKETRANILKESAKYFARVGFSGTKIGDLSKSIGIAQGTIYLYFESKEELYSEILKLVEKTWESDKLEAFAKMPLPADKKIPLLSDYLIKKIKKDEMYAAGIALVTQKLMDGSIDAPFYDVTDKIVRQGQKEGTIVSGTVRKLTEFYWGVVYLYSLKRLFTEDCKMISGQDLSRVLLKDV